MTEPTASEPSDDKERLDAVLDKMAATMLSQRRLPVSTYRLQFHAGFTFLDAARLVPYLHELGITDCYASPYLKAQPGSKHGYDITDHRVLNPEIGSEADYDTWVQAMQAHGMGQILDIVPNHMGIAGNENVWWHDILENGPCARHAGYFDIDWYPIKPELREKVLLGTFGDPYGKVLESGQLVLKYEEGSFAIYYYERRFPVAPESALLCLRLRFEDLEQTLGKESPAFMEYQSILTALSHLPGRAETNPLKIDERYREKEVIKRRLQALTEASQSIRDFIQQNVDLFNGNTTNPSSFDLLDHLLNDQAYRLSFWKVAADEINYRRFFDVNDLAALSTEKPEVFAATHVLILALLREGKVTGLRIDHPDGLYDPKQYLDRLQQHYLEGQARLLLEKDGTKVTEAEFAHLQTALRNLQATPGTPFQRPLYVVVEKILGKDEPLAEDWACDGTTGYEFLNMLNGIFVDTAQETFFGRIYHRWTGQNPDFLPNVYEKKFLILQVALSSELHILAHQLDRLAKKNRWSRDFTLNSLRHALREIIACFPVYRSYITDKVVPRDREYVEVAVSQAKRKNPAISGAIFDFVRDMLLLTYHDKVGEAEREEHRRFVGKFQQVTGPVMAKGLEDTAFYVYNRLLSLNEVGGDPGRFGVKPAALHEFFQERQKLYPHALSATSTHDTKRSEDIRARINVLTELPGDWQKSYSRWKRANKRHRRFLEGLEMPDVNDEYLLYQTLVGAWPLGASSGSNEEFTQRICQYMEKAIPEAKVHSSWVNPNPAYTEAVRRFVTRILAPQISSRFLTDFCAFQTRISHFGLFNSLSQTLLHIAAPGVPDIYQGTELWDFSLVDPDNRRPVDYEHRRNLLSDLKARMDNAGDALPALARELVQTKEDGRIKLYVTYRGLHCRRDHPTLFTTGEYLPALVLGSRAENVFAFLRRSADRWALAVVPRLVTRLISQLHEGPLGADVWQDTAVVLPGIQPHERCRNIFTGEIHTPIEREGQTILPLAEVFANFPVALLLSEEFEPRNTQKESMRNEELRINK